MRDYSFGNFISTLRRGRGLSQFQLGALVGVSDKAVSKWENGAAKPRMGQCCRLAAVLGVTVDELLSCEYHTGKGLFAMKQDAWSKAQEALNRVFGEEPSLAVVNRFEAEKAAFHCGDIAAFWNCLGMIRQMPGPTAFHVRGDICSTLTAWLLGAAAFLPLFGVWTAGVY